MCPMQANMPDLCCCNQGKEFLEFVLVKCLFKWGKEARTVLRLRHRVKSEGAKDSYKVSSILRERDEGDDTSTFCLSLLIR